MGIGAERVRRLVGIGSFLMSATEKSLAIRNLTIDYSSGHVLIDGRPIGTFVAEQGPEVVASPFEDLYIVNVPLMVRSVTFLPDPDKELER